MLNILRIVLITILALGAPLAARAEAPPKIIRRLDVYYHYFRTRRSTLTNSIDLVSRTGVFFDYNRTSRMSRRWNWYYGVAGGYNSFEASDANRLTEAGQFPWQAGLGLHYRFGRLRGMRWILGMEGGSEFYSSLEQAGVYRLRATYSGRVKTGLGILFKSVTASSAEVRGTFSYPVTPIEFDGRPVDYKGVVEGTIRMKFLHTNSWGFTMRVRFEDYELADQSATYFNTRIGLGAFWNF